MHKIITSFPVPELCQLGEKKKKKVNPGDRKKLFTYNFWQIWITKILNYSKEIILSNCNNFTLLSFVSVSLGLQYVFPVLQNILLWLESNSFIKLIAMRWTHYEMGALPPPLPYI